jgi:hypothetical protein
LDIPKIPPLISSGGLYIIYMVVVSIRPAAMSDLRMTLVTTLNLTLRKIECAQGLRIQKGFKNSQTVLLSYRMEVNQPAGLDRIWANLATALNMSLGKVGLARKMYSQKVFNFSRTALLLVRRC